MINPWDERYASEVYIYGIEPNTYLKEKLSAIKPGKILFPAEGEGRNAVYAASLGWETDALDQSIEGQKKAIKLSGQKGVTINYFLQSLNDWDPEPEQYDCIALIFVHLPESLRKKVHQAAIIALKPGGMLILEAFTINQLDRTSGGPRIAELLYTSDQIKDDFKRLESKQFLETEVILDEGPFHHGLAYVIRFCGIKSKP